MPSFQEQLNHNHFVSVPLTIPHHDLTDAAQSFLTFLTEIPEPEKRSVHFKSAFDRGSAEGYNDKRGIAGKDPKEFFHWSPRLFEYPQYHALSQSSVHARDFFERAEHLYTYLDTVTSSLFLEHFSELAPNCVIDGKLANAVLRFLCYSPRSTETFNAQPHYDKGYGTLALAESAPGLRIGCCDKHPLTEVMHTEGTALFMPADLMFEDSDRTIIPAWHDVATDSSVKPISDRCERWAIVFFIGDKDGRFSSWDKVHSPLDVHQ